MPYITPHYSLVAFTAGDPFSAALDKQTFVIIDNQLHFMSEQITDGVISGWTVTAGSGPNINVSSGTGIIQQEVTLTYGNLNAPLQNNARAYIWMQKRAGIVGQFGAFSPMGTIAYTDNTPPATPVTPTVTTNVYPTLTIGWTANTEADLDHYGIYRNGTQIDTASSPSYTDSTIAANTTYSYQISAVDVNSNVSPLSGPLLVLTAVNTSTPPDPSNVATIAGNGRVQILWDATIGAVGGYEVVAQELDGEGQTLGLPITTTTSAQTTYVIVTGLQNGYRYSFTVKSISLSGFLSSGITVYTTPSDSVGPDGIENLSVTDYALDSSGNVAIIVTWDYAIDSYLIPPAYYFITIAAAGQTGEQSIYTTTSASIAQYPTTDANGNTVTNKIVESTEYTITVQGVDDDGNAEPGSAIRHTTSKFTLPAPPTNLVLTGSWSTTAASLVANWSNGASEFSYNLISVDRVSLDGSTSNINIASSQNIGTSNKFTVPLVNLVNNARYDFTIIAVDYAGNQSLSLQGATVFSVTTGMTGGSGSGFQVSGGQDRPGVPAQQNALGEDSRIVVNWSIYPSSFVAGYNVWRANNKNTDFQASDFTKVASVGASTFTWTDYSVTNGQAYDYFVTVTDIFGNESFNPNDGYYDYSFSYAIPVSFTDLIQAPAVNVTSGGYDALLSWNQSNDSFDGFEIYRAQGTPYNFTKIGDAPPDATTFVDLNGLVKTAIITT